MLCYIYRGKTYNEKELFDKIRKNAKGFAKLNNIQSWDIQEALGLKFNSLTEMQHSILEESDFDVDGNVRPEILAEIQAEKNAIIERAKANGTYLKAPNGKATNLTEEQWVITRTKRFKNWFGDWEKQSRIDKLKNSEPIVVDYNGQYELNRESVKQWAKDNLRNKYAIDDTNEVVTISRLGINKSTSHSMGNEAHLKSFVSIPKILKNATFITEEKAEKTNAKYSKYRYYVTGAIIDGIDYTAKITIGIDENGNKFYDHALTKFEKRKLIDLVNQSVNSFISTGDKPNPSVAGSKDTKLVSILQNNSSKVVDENGEPMVVYHGNKGSEIYSNESNDIRFHKGNSEQPLPHSNTIPNTTFKKESIKSLFKFCSLWKNAHYTINKKIRPSYETDSY